MSLFETKPSIVIATGGTGGHVFPAQALASELIDYSYNVFFMGEGLKSNRYFHRNNFNYREISSSSFFKINFFRSFWRIVKGIQQSVTVLKKIKPRLVIGFGSFYTFPVLVAARLTKIPIVLFEPNAIPGKVNRLFSKWATLSTVQFAEAQKWLHGSVVEIKMPVGGNRRQIETGYAREYFYLNPHLFTFLVFGGSQGAESINHLFSQAACQLNRSGSFQVIHVAGTTQFADKLRKFYADAGIPACVKIFEERMDLAWSAATVAICRSGAATIAEQMSYAVPAILIPFPRATDDHQTKNAQFVEKKVQGAIMCPEATLTVEKLKMFLTQMLDSDQRTKMQQALLAFNQDQQKQPLSSVIRELLRTESLSE